MAEALTPSDGDLLRRLRDREEEAFTLLYRRWQGPLFRYALRMGGSPALAEDVTQEVFMTLLRGSQGYDPGRGALAAYLHGIARNLVRRRLERDPRTEPLADAAALDDPLDEVARREASDLVWSAVLSLSLPLREAVVLCDLQGLTYEEAAGALGCPIGSVRSRLHRGRARLAARLKDARTASWPAAAQAAR